MVRGRRVGAASRGNGLVARRHGVDEAQLRAIGEGRRPVLGDPACEAAYEVAAGLVHDRRLDDETAEGAKRVLGERGLVELVTLVGFYQLVSGVLIAFDPPPPSVDWPVVGPPSSGDLAR